MTTIDIDAIRTDLDTRQQYIDLGKQPSVAAYLAGTIADRVPALLARADALTAELARARARVSELLAFIGASESLSRAAELTEELALARRDRDEYAAVYNRVAAQLTAANRRNDGLQADLNSATKANTAWANENLRLREQVFAQKPVIEAAEAWAEAWEGLKGDDTVPYAVAQPSAALHDAIEQHRLMDLALTSARTEQAEATR